MVEYWHLLSTDDIARFAGACMVGVMDMDYVFNCLWVPMCKPFVC